MTETTAPEFIVTECPDHGVKVTADYASFVQYVSLALGCDAERRGDLVVFGIAANPGTVTRAHADWHEAEGTSCWSCCNRMTVDPHGLLD